jgi:hypothetical protein
MKFIQNQQSREDTFTFPLCESVSLLFSRRLIVFSDSRPISAHALLCLALSQGFPLRSVFSYAMFSRFAASARKPNDPSIRETKDSPKSQGFAAIAESAASLGPRRAEGYFELLHPVTQLIKVPDNHGLPSQASLSLPGFPPTKLRDGAPLLYPISFRCVVVVKPGPQMNRAVVRFDGSHET